MNAALVPAAGIGKRMGAGEPKQFLMLAGKPVIAHTLGRLQESPEIGEIIIAAPGEYHERVRAIAREHGITKLSSVVTGGEQRQHSVWNAMQAAGTGAEIILVHDAVRPFVSLHDIHSVIEAAKRHGAAILAVHMKETVKVADEHEFVINTLDRDYLWSVQTPQAFRRDVLFEALRKAMKEHVVGTDEASFVEYYGGDVKIVEGSEGNLKITTRDDLRIAYAILRNYE